MEFSLGILIPCYNVSKSIEKVVDKIIDNSTLIILCDDKSKDNTFEIILDLEKKYSNVLVVQNPENLGVGGAMKTLFKKALEFDIDYLIKIDGDDQMDPFYFNKLIDAIKDNEFGFSKGNRFVDFNALKQMPTLRRVGNLVLSFMIKITSGYWGIFDPTNGYFCIKKNTLEKLNIDKLSNTYFFESSLIINLGYIGTKIVDVPIPAKYGDEISNLSISKVIFEFPPKFLLAFFKRILFKYFLYDFNIGSIYLLIGFPLFLFGLFFGLFNWYYYDTNNIATPTGTIMIAVISIVLGFQLLLSFLQQDIEKINR